MPNKNNSKSKTQQKVQKQVEKNVKKVVKRFTFGNFVAILLCLSVGIAGGIFSYKFITRNDGFILNGDKSFSIKLNEEFTYKEDGFTCVSMGKNISDKVKVETNMMKNEDGSYSIDTSVEGEYYIIYTVEDKKFGDIKRVRTFVVGDANE